MSAWTVKTQRAPPRRYRGGKVYGRTTSAKRDMGYPHTPRLTQSSDYCYSCYRVPPSITDENEEWMKFQRDVENFGCFIQYDSAKMIAKLQRHQVATCGKTRQRYGRQHLKSRSCKTP